MISPLEIAAALAFRSSVSTGTLSPEEFAWRIHRYTPKLWITAALIGINVAVYVLMVATGVSWLNPSPSQLVAWGGNAGVLSLGAGQSWRLFTCMFVHAGIVHIGMNMYVLWDIGRFIERLLGNAGLLVVYLLSGLVGSLASALSHPQVVSVGASGAVFGLYGVLMGFLARIRRSIPAPMLRRLRSAGGAFVVYNLVFSVAVAGIDLSAHLGGLVAGFVLGAAISAPLTDECARRRPLRTAAVALVGALAVIGVTWALRPN